MKIDELKYSLTNLMHRRLRSFLSVLSILIGITSIFAVVSFGLGVRIYMEDIAEEMSLHPELKRFEPREGMVMKEYLQTPPEFAENRNSFRGLLTKSIEYARRLPPKSEAK